MENAADPATPSVSTSLYTTANASTLEANTSVNGELGDSILILENPNSNDNSFNPEEQNNATICLDSTGDITSSSIVELSNTSTPMVPSSKRKPEKNIDERSFSVVIDDGGLNASSEEDSELDLGEEDTVEPSNLLLGEVSSALPDTVTLLTTPDGGSVYLIGTAHFSKESQDDVAKVIQAVQPHVVLVELCKARVNILQLDEQTILEEAKNINFEKIKSTIQQNGFFHGIMNILLLSMSAHLTKELGMAPGGEFRQAFSEAKKVPNCVVHLGDRPIKLTIQRALASLTWWQTLKLSWHIMSKESISKEQVERCKQRDLLEEMLEQLTGEFPAFSRVFVAERDLYLANSLQLAALPIPCPSAPLGYIPAKVVGVVGMGHVPGIVQHWGRVDQDAIPAIMEIPPPSLTSRVLKLTIKASLLGLFVWGCVRILPLPPFSRDIARGAENSLRSLKATVQGLFQDQCIWIVLQIWSLFAVYVIIGYLLLVSWVNNGNSWDVLTKCRIQGLDTMNDVLDCAKFNGEVFHVGPDCLDVFYIVYIVVPSKVMTVIRYFGRNPHSRNKQSLFCWSKFVIPKGKCEIHSENFLKDLICRRNKYISRKEVESVINMLHANGGSVFLFEIFLFPFNVGNSQVIIFNIPLAKILSNVTIFLSFPLEPSFTFLCSFKIIYANFSCFCIRSILKFLRDNSIPQFCENCALGKIEIVSSEGHERVELILSDFMKERNCIVSNENGTFISELGMRTKGNGHEIKGKGDLDKGKEIKGEVVGREIGIGLGEGGGGGCGRDDEDDGDPPDCGVDYESAEDSSHEEEDSEREMDEPIDNYFHPLPNIFYIPTNVPGPGANLEDFESAFQGCTCAEYENGICNQNCQCVMRSMGPNYDDVGFLLLEKLSGNIPVFECSEYCDCSNICGNRRVQFGPMPGLTIFETTTNTDVCSVYTNNSFRVLTDGFKCTGKGLGLRTLKHVSKGSFICEYAGEIIGREEAFRRWRNDYIEGNPNYILALQEWISQSQSSTIVNQSSDCISFLAPGKCVDNVINEEHLEKSKIVTYIDPTRVGNIGRYANHSCDPNAIAVTVRVGNPVPRLCLFAAKDIMPDEEVTFDYAGLQISLPSEDASSTAKRDPQLEKQNCSSSVCILPDLHFSILGEKCRNTCDGANLSTDGILDDNLSRRLKFHVPLHDDGDSVSENHVLEHRRTLCLCGTKNCRKYLPFGKDWL